MTQPATSIRFGSPQEMRSHALKQQELLSRPDAPVMVRMVASRWPKSGRLKLFSGGRGPWGRVVAQEPGYVYSGGRGRIFLVEFSAREVIQACDELIAADRGG